MTRDPGKRMTIAMGETHTHTHRHSWKCKTHKRIQIKIKTMPKTKTKRKLAQDACVCVCIQYTIYDIHVCPKMLVSQFSTDEKLTISLPFPYPASSHLL